MSNDINRIAFQQITPQGPSAAPGNGAEDAALKKAVTDFEAIFLNQMLKNMRDTVMKSGLLDGGQAEETYNSMMDYEMSRFLAAGGGIGLHKVLLDAFGGNAPTAHIPLKTPAIGPVAPYGGVEVNNPPAQERSTLEKVGDKVSAIASKVVEETASKLPVFGWISSYFGLRNDPITGARRVHEGIDIAATRGLPIYPLAEGRVVFAGVRSGYGNTVEVMHPGGHVTRYAHTEKNLVKQGDIVKTSEPIAHVGSSGRSTGSHLHLEVTRDGEPLDPMDFIGEKRGIL